MAHAKNHDYHILPPSIWPLMGAGGAFTMLFGAVLWMHGSGPWLGLIGLAVVLYTMFGWWSEVVHEGQTGDHTPVVRIGLRYGVIMFIMSEVMFFVAWFWIFFEMALFHEHRTLSSIEEVRTAWATWPPQGIETVPAWNLPLLNTLILLTSGVTLTIAHHALKAAQRTQVLVWLGITVLLGCLFLFFQVEEYLHAYQELNLTLGSGIYGSTFFMLTGFHGAHVFLGTLMLLIMWFRVLKGHFTKDDHFAFEAAAWYWHFVDVVWLALFLFVYVL